MIRNCPGLMVGTGLGLMEMRSLRGELWTLSCLLLEVK